MNGGAWLAISRFEPWKCFDKGGGHFASLELVVVNLEGFSDFPQSLSYDLLAKGTVDEKD